MKGKSKLWIGLGIWFALCLAAMIFLATLGGGNGSKNNNTTAGFYYPGKEIQDQVGDEAGITAIRRLLAEPPTYEDPNASRYSEALDNAARAADRGSAELYQAYRYYQTAIRYSDNREQPFKNQNDVLRYDRILDELAKLIYTRYIYAFRAYHEGRYQEARDVLERLRMDYYAEEDPNDNLANHIRKLRNAAHQRAR